MTSPVYASGVKYPSTENFLIDVGRGILPLAVGKRIFGRNSNQSIGNNVDIWEGNATFVPPTAARLHNIASSSANDTNTAGTGARQVTIQGLGAGGVVQTEVVSLNGLSNVPTANTYIMINLMYVSSVGSGGSNAGTITATAQ